MTGPWQKVSVSVINFAEFAFCAYPTDKKSQCKNQYRYDKCSYHRKKLKILPYCSNQDVTGGAARDPN